MKTRTIAFLAVVASMGFGGVGLAACSSTTNNPSGSLPGVDSGGGKDSTTSGQDGSTATDGGTGGDSSASDTGTVDCGRPPSLHDAAPDTGVFCPFQAPDSSIYCQTTQHCCNPGVGNGVSTCSDACNFTVDGGADFQCDNSTHCAGNQVCCMNGTVLTDTKCGTLYGSKVKGTTCRDACQAGEIETCAHQNDCTTGTCSAFSTKGKDLAYCKP